MKNHSEANCPLELCKKEFIDQLVSIKREGISDLIKYLESTDFFEAPASVNQNESREGGQLRHALNVMTRMISEEGQEALLSQEKNKKYPGILESITIVSLLSGIWKAGYFRKVLRKITREDGTVEKIPGYGVRPPEERLCYGSDQDHGDEAVYIIQGFIRLTRQEAFAIRSQDWDPRGEEARRVFAKNPLALQLHIAELKAMFIDERD